MIMWFMLLARDTSHFEMSVLKAFAFMNILFIFVTRDTSHFEMSTLKEFALESGKKNKIEFMNLRQSFFRPGNFLDAIQNTELTVGKIIAKVMES